LDDVIGCFNNLTFNQKTEVREWEGISGGRPFQKEGIVNTKA
jgi:hypothetical protein